MNVKLCKLSLENKKVVEANIDAFIECMKVSSPIEFDEDRTREELLLLHRGMITAMKDMKKRRTTYDMDGELFSFLQTHIWRLSAIFDRELVVRKRYYTMTESYIIMGFVDDSSEYRISGDYYV